VFCFKKVSMFIGESLRGTLSLINKAPTVTITNGNHLGCDL
jgi:hypothetical protein